MKKLQCPKCGHKWEWSFWEWIMKAPIQHFNFIAWKDRRKTTCPQCGKESWITAEKNV